MTKLQVLLHIAKHDGCIDLFCNECPFRIHTPHESIFPEGCTLIGKKDAASLLRAELMNLIVEEVV